MIVRIAFPKDADTVGQVHSSAWKSAYLGIIPDDFIDSDTAEKRKTEFLESIKDKNCTYYLLEESNQVAGIVKAHKSNNILEVESIYILSEFRGKGLGKQFFDFIKANRSECSIFLWVLEANTNARHFYESIGFIPTGDTRTITRGVKLTQVRYEYRITSP